MSQAAPPTLGVVLAGGLSRRMGGGDKALARLGGRTLLEHVAERLRPQCAGLLLNANGDPARFAFTGLPVVADGIPGFAGPLAGVLAGLEAATESGAAWIVTAPADAPFLPTDLVARLHAAREAAGARLAVAASGGRTHPVVALWPVDLRAALRARIEAGARAAGAVVAGFAPAVVDWPTQPHDPFVNINTPAELAAAERLLDGPDVAVLDLKGLKCPLPALYTRKRLATLTPGALLTVEATDPLAAIDIPHLCGRTGDLVEHAERRGDVLVFRIRKAGAPAP